MYLLCSFCISWYTYIRMHKQYVVLFGICSKVYKNGCIFYIFFYIFIFTLKICFQYFSLWMYMELDHLFPLTAVRAIFLNHKFGAVTYLWWRADSWRQSPSAFPAAGQQAQLGNRDHHCLPFVQLDPLFRCVLEAAPSTVQWDSFQGQI